MAKYQKVFLRIVGMVADTPTDSDKLPDRVLADGEINLKPNIREGAAENTYGPDGIAELELPNPVKCRIVDGWLNYNDDPYVWLRVSEEGWNWNISFTNLRVAGIGKKLDAFNFDLVPATDDQIVRGQLAPTAPNYYWGVNLAPLVEFPNPNTGTKTVKGDTGYSIQSVELVGQGGFRFVTNNPNPLEATLPVVTVPLFEQSATATAANAAAAALSEAAALASKNAAKTSETNAKTSETNAKTSENNALAYRNTANTAATNAGTSAGNAATSATNAGTSAAAALASQNSAKTSETNSKTSETNAKTSETNAKTSETNAGASATASQASRVASESARTTAEQAAAAATSMVVPDNAVTRPKLKTQDHTNLIFGAGFEGGIEAQDWPINTFGAAATIDTTAANVWFGTRALKLTGNGEMAGPTIPAHPGEHFLFSAMVFIPTAIAGAGGLRIQFSNGTTWSDAGSSDITTLPLNVYTKSVLSVIAPAGTKAVRWRIAFALGTWGSGVFIDETDFRRGIEILPNDIVGTNQIGAKQVTGAKVADGAIADSQIFSTANIAQSKLAAAGWIADALAARALVAHSHVATEISNSTATGRSVLTAADATAARSAIGAGTSSLAIGTTSTTAAAGNDGRLTDNRVPLDNSVIDAKVPSGANINPVKLGTGRVIGYRNGAATSTPIEVMTEAQYQALATKDSNTLYFRSA